MRRELWSAWRWASRVGSGCGDGGVVDISLLDRRFVHSKWFEIMFDDA